MKKHLSGWPGSILLMLFFGCSIADEDRCGDGLWWDESVQACRPVDTDTSAGSDTGTANDGGPGDSDGGDGGADSAFGGDTATPAATETGPTFGDECTTDADCTGAKVASFCQLNPLTPGEPGFCTLRDCVPGDCPDGYQCCDCSHLNNVISCVPDEGAAQAEAYTCVCS